MPVFSGQNNVSNFIFRAEIRWQDEENDMKKTMQSEPKRNKAKKAGSCNVGTGRSKHGFLINKELPSSLEAQFEEIKQKLSTSESDGDESRVGEEQKEEKILFAVVSDLTLHGKYGDSALIVTDKRFFVVSDNKYSEYPFSEVMEIKVKRMYGNACIFLESRGGKRRRVFRYTYSVAALCDMATQFILSVSAGNSLKEELDVVEGTFDKLNLICPRCGRTLIRAGAECIHCQSKSKIISKLLKYVKPEFGMLMFCVVLSGITTAITLLPPYMTRKIVDDVLPMKDTGNVAEGLKMLSVIVAVLFASYVVDHVIAAFRGYLLKVSGDKIVLNLRNDIFAKAQKLPMRFYDKTSTGSVINRISGDTSTLQAFILKITQECIVQFILLIGIVVIMTIMNPPLTLLSLLPIPFVVIASRIFAKKIAPFYKRIWRRWSAVTSIMTDSIPCIRIVKAFAGEKRAVDRFNKYNQEWYKVDVASSKITQTFPHILGFVVTCGSLFIWAVGGRWAMNGVEGISAGLLVSFISYASMFYGPVRFFANLSDSYQSALNSIERIFDILDAEPEVNDPDAYKPEHLEGKIEFKNVNFSFDKTKKTLSDINLTIEPGDIVGIVGTTGSGKSTLINLLMRFYDHYEGEILVDGRNIKQMDIESYRSCIGYVQQEPMMFSDTIFNNIAYGVPNANVEQVIHAAEVANAHEFIARLPDGYDSMLGERGTGVSGGEKQRLSIARAVLKNPSILVFDEATAAVDSETENLIQSAIERLISGRTTLMIAHRLSTLRKANKIVVVDKGSIIEFGSHDELMALKGKYYKLIQIQSMGQNKGEGLTIPD